MKKITKLSAALILLLAFAVQTTGSPLLLKRKNQDPQSFITIKGKVVDAKTKKSLIFATIAVRGTNVATVSNLDGEFILKVASSLSNPEIEILYIGYKNSIVPVSDLKDEGRDNTIELTQSTIPIREIVITPISPEEILEKAIRNVSDNYIGTSNLMTSFYRETIKKNKNYVSIAEAVVEIFKSPYNNDFRYDMARVYKGRKNVEESKLDTVLFRLQGGPVTTLQLDLVKNPQSILTLEAMNSYDYELANIVVIDEMPHFVIDFHQKSNIDIPLFLGRRFINVETFALTEAEVSINLEDPGKATDI
ncbi:MAG: carboxypeptidase-like regulatory domain-containing protein, partial [Bacteroidales bacterium]|nr:carboxypeptidase-like regulatory domain-containing protein [Bacteroidales bacterium]